MKNRIAAGTIFLIALVSITVSLFLGCEPENNTQQQISNLRDEVNTSFVNLPNPNGSITPVAIKRSGNVYIGPNGEQYATYPTVEQLQPIYGIK